MFLFFALNLLVTFEPQGDKLSLSVLLLKKVFTFFFLGFPSRVDRRMTGAGNNLEANAKDGFLRCFLS